MAHATNRPGKIGMSRRSGEKSGLGKYRVVLVSLVLFFAGVSARVSVAAAPDSLSWLPIGPGVNYATADSALGEDVFIGIGGWTVTQALSNSWVTALYAARLHTLGVRHLYSIMGPKDIGYQSREIGTLDLARHLLLQIRSHPASNRIIVAGHSSGVYVAHAIFQDLYDGAGIDSSHLTDSKILYFVLDEPLGTYPAVELTDASANRLGHIYGVYAFVPSRNLYSYAPAQMIALGNRYGSRSSSLAIDASGSGCTAMLCLHMTLINQKPYNPNSFDSRDYGAINPDHPVQTEYLDVITGVAHAHHVSLSRLGRDTIVITARVENPLGHAVNVTGILTSGSGVLIDSVFLKDDGLHGDSSSADGLWGCQYVPMKDDTINVTVRTDDLTLGASLTIPNAGSYIFTRGQFISVDTRTVTLGNLHHALSRFDTTFQVSNLGWFSDSIYVSLDPIMTPDSAISVSPIVFALPAGASRAVTFSVLPRWLSAGVVYNAVVIVDSRFGFGQTHFEKTFAFGTTAVSREPSLPSAFALYQNYPNPFNPSTMIGFGIQETGFTTLKVYDVLGREVGTLVGEVTEPGTHTVEFNVSGLASGVYYYRLQVSGFVAVKKMLLVR